MRIRDAMNTRQIIMDAAFELFETKSFKEISVQEILNKAGVSRGTFYTHFRDKYELMHQYFSVRIGDFLIVGFDGRNWFEQQKRCFDYFLSHSPYLANVKNTHGQDSFWQFLFRYSQEFYISVRKHNSAAPLSAYEETVTAGIAAASVHYYSLCINDPENCDPEAMTLALSELIPLSYRAYV